MLEASAPALGGPGGRRRPLSILAQIQSLTMGRWWLRGPCVDGTVLRKWYDVKEDGPGRLGGGCL